MSLGFASTAPYTSCDFCNKPTAKFVFPCLDFIHQGHRFYGAWSACGACTVLINAEQNLALARQYLQTTLDAHILPTHVLIERTAAVLRLHDKFRLYRIIGPPVLISHYENQSRVGAMMVLR